jgi:hypothetical protein
MTAVLAHRPTVAAPTQRTVTLRPAPRREPPFDDELDRDAVCGAAREPGLPFELVRQTPPLWRPRVATRSDLPDPAAWARRLLVGMVETAGGKRPLHQLAAFLSPSVHRGLTHEFDRSNGRDGPHWMHRAMVRTIRATEPSEGVAELCVLLETGQRVRALAMRLEQHHGRWRCIRMQIG